MYKFILLNESELVFVENSLSDVFFLFNIRKNNVFFIFIYLIFITLLINL